MLNSDERQHRKELVKIIRGNLYGICVTDEISFAIASMRADFAEYLRSGHVTVAGLRRWAQVTRP